MSRAKSQKRTQKKEEDKQKRTQKKEQNKVQQKLKVAAEKHEPNEIIHNLVWAKLRFCPYWPARICTAPTEMKTNGNKKGKVCVFFFGSKN